MLIRPTFSAMHSTIEEEFLHRSYAVHPDHWQAVDVSKKPEMAMRELLNYSFQVPLRGLEDLVYWREDILPNLPFADVHFAERVGGLGTNPGEAWKIWPWGNAADAHRTENGKFTHTYQERFWPKWAGLSPEVILYATSNPSTPILPNRGIRYDYADLNDLIRNLADDPLTRQAYLPIWFPEDGACPGRKPCTLGYHLICRHGYLHLVYYIRSCDFIRHWRDDCYLAVRLLLWVLDRLREKDEKWKQVKPGLYTMHITSFHMFINDFNSLKAKHEVASNRISPGKP